MFLKLLVLIYLKKNVEPYNFCLKSSMILWPANTWYVFCAKINRYYWYRFWEIKYLEKETDFCVENLNKKKLKKHTYMWLLEFDNT